MVHIPLSALLPLTSRQKLGNLRPLSTQLLPFGPQNLVFFWRPTTFALDHR